MRPIHANPPAPRAVAVAPIPPPARAQTCRPPSSPSVPVLASRAHVLLPEPLTTENPQRSRACRAKPLAASQIPPNPESMAPFPPAPSAPRTIVDFFTRPAKRLRAGAAAPAASLSSSASSLSPEQRRRADTNLAHARARRNLRLAESKAPGGAAKLEELLVEETWQEALPGELRKPYALDLCRFVTHERLHGPLPVYPPPHLVFHALNATPFDRVKAVIIGQDPYHGPGQAMGLSFSVPEGIKIPSSLGNIFKELEKDLGCTVPSHGNLERWAVQGVLMLNTVLTVREHQANSHAKKGWEQFTDAVIRTISQKKSGVVFLLWGNSAQSKTRLIDETKHHILKSAHPSGLSANRGFFGCRHFSKTNQILERLGLSAIDWQL